MFDDVHNLEAMNANGGVVNLENFIRFVFGNESGSLGRPIAMASFLINDQHFPGEVSSFRWTNLMIHLLCGIIILVLIYQVLNCLKYDENTSRYIALFVAAWWLLAPLNMSTTLYVIQRMTQLSALFTALGLVIFIKGRNLLSQNRDALGWTLILMGLYGIGGLAIFSKENGILIFLYAIIFELSIFNPKLSRSEKLVWIPVILPVIALLSYFYISWSGFQKTTLLRDFSMSERLMTESRILFDYVVKAIAPFYSKMGLFSDDYEISKGLFDPPSTILAIISHFLFLCLSIFYRKRYPILLLCAGWFYVGHLLESSFIPLELYFEHRNYFPIVGIYLLIVATLWKYGTAGRFGIAIGLFIAIVFSAQRAELWGKPDKLFFTWAMERPDSVRAQTQYIRLLSILDLNEEASKRLENASNKWPEHVHFQLLKFNFDCKDENSPLKLPEFKNNGTKYRYTGSLTSILEEAIDKLKDGDCTLENKSSIHNFLGFLILLDKAPPKFKAKVAYWDAEFYVMERNLNGAITALDNAYSFQRLSIIRYRQSLLLFSAGLLVEANQFIDMAIKLENEKKKLININSSANKTLYKEMKYKIERQLAEDPETKRPV